ncbi:MAG: disulfide reductase [Dehalococcoidia bacterium]|nr:MAG: disulfide reductase [Dehalococcoidia bacterium]
MKVSYYPGCSLSGTAREYGESVEAVCRRLEVELHELTNWSCCGSSSAHVTNDMLAVALAARNLEIADRVGMDLVVPCAACYHRLKVAEKELLAGKQIEGISDIYKGDFRIKHIVDFLWEDVGEGALKEKVKKQLGGLNLVCYYGCLTARPPKVTDAKRPEDPQAMDYLMKSLGANVKSWSYKTACCGGNLILTRPDIAIRLIQKILDMALEAGADCVVTGCPMCYSNLDRMQKQISKETGEKYNIPIFYLTELLGVSLGEPSAKRWLRRHFTDATLLLRRVGLT